MMLKNECNQEDGRGGERGDWGNELGFADFYYYDGYNSAVRWCSVRQGLSMRSKSSREILARVQVSRYPYNYFYACRSVSLLLLT